MNARTPTFRAALPTVLKEFSLIVVVLWAASIAFACLSSHPLHSLDGFRWIYYEGAAFDYYDYTGRMYYLHRQEFFLHPGYRWYYPAADVFPLQFFYCIGRLCGSWLVGYLSYVAVSLGGVTFALVQLAKALRDRGVSLREALFWTVSTGLFSWPIYFALQRGNIEAVTWLILAAAIWAYGRQRWMLAALLLGVVAAFKFYPALCFGLFLQPRRWKEMAAGLGAMALVTLAALRYILPDVSAAFTGVSEGMAQWINDYARSYGPASATYDHSLYELTKVVTQILRPNYATFVERYMVVVGVCALLLFLLRVRRLPSTNQVLFLVTAAVFLPPASFDYTLVNLYVPFGWLVLAAVRMHKVNALGRPLRVALLLFGLVFGPETFFIVNDMTAAGILKGILLLSLLALSVVCPLEEITGTNDRALAESV